MTYLYHRWEQVFGKDGLDLLLWIMIFLILQDSITSWAGAAKITAHQAVTTVTLQVFSKEKLENSGKTNSQRWQVWREASWPYLCYHFYQGLFHWSSRDPSPDLVLMLWWVSLGTAVPWPRWHWHIWASPLAPAKWAGCFSWARPIVCWVWSSLYFIKAALGHSPVIARLKTNSHQNWVVLSSSKGEINESLHIIRTKSTFFCGIKCLKN